MKVQSVSSYKTITLRACVVGSGAAGLCAAAELSKNGVKNIAIITEGKNQGTSRNTGSDKQTYYKLGLSGGSDSPMCMARDLFNGGCVDGDNALAEAANSVECFINLSRLGVPFPTDRYGQYVGYKTDHDPKSRAASAGPLTSQMMTEALEKDVVAQKIPTLDGLLVISIITKNGRAVGLLALDKARENGQRFVLINCSNIIFATGGPACVYANTVYPNLHTGSSGVLVEAGVAFQNLTEWQYGLASISPKWNVSGTYMQALPRFVSVDEGGEQRYFVEEYFGCPEALNKTFLKGYEWPFDSKKLEGSSIIDLLVYIESNVLNRSVYLDFRANPFGLEDLPYSNMSVEAREYLSACGACFGAPIDRLLHMNAPAYDLFYQKGVDLRVERLKIALCAQHHNGGASVDVWWQSSLKGLFVVGEAAGTHGVTRPGGSALNAGQVGALRAAKYISYCPNDNMRAEAFKKLGFLAVEEANSLCDAAMSDKSNIAQIDKALKLEMSKFGGVVRERKRISRGLKESLELLEQFSAQVSISSDTEIESLFKLKDALAFRTMLLFAFADYIENGGKTRGSAVYPKADVNTLQDLLNIDYDFISLKDKIQEVEYSNGGFSARWRKVRELPISEESFENIWRTYRKNGNVF